MRDQRTDDLAPNEGTDREKASRAAILRRLPLFAQVDDEDLLRLAAITREVRHDAGQVVFRRGDPGTELYFVLSGAVRVEQGSRVLARIGPGEVVGELAVLDHSPRSADVVAGEETLLLRMRGDELQQLVDRQPSLARALLRVLAARVRERGSRQERVEQLVRAYRERGHVLAELDPLGFERPGEHPELTLGYHGLDEADLDRSCTVTFGEEPLSLPLRGILEHLRATYCGAVGVQYTHIDDLAVQRWLRARLEDASGPGPEGLQRDEQLRILAKLTDAEVFETFLHRTFRSKRFSLEGSETLIPLLDQAIERAGAHGVEEIVLGMAHRGRLNVLANIMGKPASRIFQEFEDAESDPSADRRAGDVKYHMGFDAERVTASGARVRLSLCFNPSHLEFVGPVVLGRVRALQDRRGGTDAARARVLPLLIHGDGSFAGQGIIQESLNLSGLPGYTTGGTLHVVLNNQIGFTTPPSQARSTHYATDVARMLQIPIFHVNGERPEAVDRVIRLAMEFRATFQRDVVIDMYGYRRHGHNERDEPAFTQPLLTRVISERRPIRVTYAENLLRLGQITPAEVEEIAARSQERLAAELAAARATLPAPAPQPGPGASREPLAVDSGRLSGLLARLAELPAGFRPHPKVERLLAGRLAMSRGERPVDWGTGETLAYATLLTDGVPVRVSGQDSERGTFAHRHAVIHDRESGARWAPLMRLDPGQARFAVYNSPLSEAAVLGFEFGWSLGCPQGLAVWEAQFGDFCNGAQVLVDQFVTSSADKWDQESSLCLILPHGFEGQGPEHSSARLERFLQLAARDNVRVVQPTTASQVFHGLRAQLVPPRRPLILVSPKGQLLHPSSASTLAELAGGRFEPVLADRAPVEPAPRCRRVLVCGGQIHQRLARAREERGRRDVAIVRLEQYYPFPGAELGRALDAFPREAEVVWVQEEPENMGAWSWLVPRLGPALGGRRLGNVCRPESASPATGSLARHQREEEGLVDRAFAL